MAALNPSIRALAGLSLAGYGLLVLLGVLPHDAPVAGALSLALGAALLALGVPRVELRRGRLVAGLGVAALLGVLGFNAATRSDLSAPEWAILLYGTALVGASPFLERRVGPADVATLVGWSFPLLLAPLAVFALNGMLSSPDTGAAASPLVAILIVVPTAWGLRILGTPVQVDGNNLVLPVTQGTLTLDVGLICAGIYPMVLFGGLVGLHAWRERIRGRHLALLVGVGLAGLWLANLVRLVVLAKVGQAWGATALQETHANLGWIVFALFMLGFWAIALKRREQPSATGIESTG